MGDIFLVAGVLAALAVATVLVNRILDQMRKNGIPTGESLCGGNPNCSLRQGDSPAETADDRPKD